jgi:transposase
MTKGNRVPAVSCGIDWAEDHHDVAIVDEHGAVISAERIGNDAAGLARLLQGSRVMSSG